MKKLFFLLLALPMMVSAQDTLITVMGDTISCKIKTITPDKISYSDATGDRLIELTNVKDKRIHSHPLIIDKKGESSTFNNPVLEINLAGEELMGASRTWFAGFAVLAIGAAVLGSGAALLNKSNKVSIGMMAAGGALSAAGSITMAVSFNNIYKAGIRLKRYHPE